MNVDDLMPAGAGGISCPWCGAKMTLTGTGSEASRRPYELVCEGNPDDHAIRLDGGPPCVPPTPHGRR